MPKRWSPVLIVWIDSCGADNGWEDPNDLSCKPITVTTIGLFWKRNKHGITVVHNRTRYDVAGHTFVPEVNIVSVTELVPADKVRTQH